MPIDTFPTLPGLTWPVPRAPSAVQARNVTLSGRRTVMPMQSVPRWTWQLSYEMLRSVLWSDGNGAAGTYAELETLAAFFIQRATQGDVFLFQDPQDSQAVQQGFGQGDGATTQFQLVRAYGGFAEPVYSATVTEIRLDGTPLAPGYTVSAKGVVTFSVAPGAGVNLDWSGVFKWYCRFDDDSLDLAQFMQGMNSTQSPVKFSSEILP